MTIIEYIQKLNKAKETAIGRFSNLGQLEQAIVAGTYEWLINNLEIKRGDIVVDAALTDTMNNFVQAVLDIISNNKLFTGRVSSFLQDLGGISKNLQSFHATTNHFDIQKAGVTDVQQAVVDEIMNQFLGNGLNQGFVTPLRDNVFRNILAAASIKDVKQVLTNYIISGADKTGKLGSYLHNTAIQAVDVYEGAINHKLMQEFTFTGFIISGSLIETSSTQCVHAVEESNKTGGYLPFSEWEKILTIARNNKRAPLIPGTTLENLPLQRLHWGCRHSFSPIVKK